MGNIRQKPVTCASVGCGEARTASFALSGQTPAKLHNASDYANKQSGFAFRFAFRFAPFVRIICTI